MITSASFSYQEDPTLISSAGTGVSPGGKPSTQATRALLSEAGASGAFRGDSELRCWKSGWGPETVGHRVSGCSVRSQMLCRDTSVKVGLRNLLNP